MKKFNIEVELTNDEVSLLQELELEKGNRCVIPWKKLEIVNSIERKGLLIQGSRLDDMFMTVIGMNILKLIN